MATTELVGELREQRVAVSEQPTIEQRLRGDRWRLVGRADAHASWRCSARPKARQRPKSKSAAGTTGTTTKAPTGSRKISAASTAASHRRSVYAFNVLIGHHGLFSLTPIWLLSAAGCVHVAERRTRARGG